MQYKILIIFHIFAQNIDCGYRLEPPRRGGSNMYPQTMFWSKNKKNMYTPAYPSFAILKFGISGYILHANEPPHEKPNNLHMRKQRRRSASR